MKSVDITIKNKVGLHARPASLFVRTALKYESDITVNFNGKKANAKSLLELMVLEVIKDSVITITADGSDEAAAVADLVTLAENNFGE